MAIDHVVVVGAGAIGSLYAAKLAAHARVHVIARPAHAAAINQHGLRVTGVESFTAPLSALSASTAIDHIAPRTLVLLTTKVNDNRAAIEPLAAYLHSDTTILCIQNGYGGEALVRDVTTAAGRDAVVLRAITQYGAIFSEPGVVDYRVAGQTLIERHARSAAIAELFNRAGLNGQVCDAIAVEVWRKLIFNCVINPITAMTGTDVGGIADDRLNPLKQLVVDECLAVARAEGIVLDGDFLTIITTVFGASRNIASMRQDLIKGRPTEIDYMNGAVVRLGAQHGIGCPVNSALTTIIRALERKSLKSEVGSLNSGPKSAM
jgi:2-dehydropantoate 2-reductase